MVYLVILAGGLAGSLHCIGMCGGFPLALAGGRSDRPLLRQLLYNLGRVNALVFIGAASGLAGAAAVATGPAHVVERVLAVVAGVFMILVGLEMLGWLGRISRLGAALARATVGRLLGGVIQSRSLAAPLALGVFNAFLPCHLVYAFAARAASTASAVEGALTMLVFGLGTVPAMLTVGLARGWARPAFRARLAWASGALVVVFGMVTLARGIAPGLHGTHGSHAPHVHEHAGPDATLRGPGAG